MSSCTQPKQTTAEMIDHVMNSGELVVTAKQAAAVLSCNERTVTRMCERGQLKAVKVMSMWRINRAALLDYIGASTAA